MNFLRKRERRGKIERNREKCIGKREKKKEASYLNMKGSSHDIFGNLCLGNDGHVQVSQSRCHDWHVHNGRPSGSDLWGGRNESTRI